MMKHKRLIELIYIWVTAQRTNCPNVSEHVVTYISKELTRRVEYHRKSKIPMKLSTGPAYQRFIPA